VNRICPNCQYVRKPTDTAPEWQCPQCEIAYNKGAGAAVTEGYGRYAAPSVTRSVSRPGVAKWLVLLIVLGFGVWVGRPIWQPSQSATQQRAAQAGQPEVVLYATDWCGYCATTREFFSANGIRYTELDIEKSSTALEGHRRLGGNGVPLVVVGDNLVHGYNEAELRSLLRPWLRKT
jgi:glutaredoxin